MDEPMAAGHLSDSMTCADAATTAQLARRTVAIIGGGPAGLTAAHALLQRSEVFHPVVLEATDHVGGIARTETYKGYRIDIGGHRFFTKVAAIEALWRDLLGPEFKRRPRLSRILYRGKYFAYPLKLFDTLANIGTFEALRIILSYVKWQVRPHLEETNFEQWVTNRFGGRLFWHFFKSYTEKVWGLPCSEIQADWAAQRIKNLSLRKAVWNALTGSNDTVSMIDGFDYPRLGPGMMWEACRDRVVAGGGEVRMGATVTRIERSEESIEALEISSCGGSYRLAAEAFVSSMPLAELVLAMVPPAPAAVRTAAKRLKYRDFLIVALILDGPDVFPDTWIYVHDPHVQVGRLQNFRAWSPDMVPDAGRSSLGMEYFCQEGDALWALDDRALIARAAGELERLGLAPAAAVVDGTVIRQPKAYPVYDDAYQGALATIRGWLERFDNLQVVGRNGMHRYNNQDHSMLTALLAVDNLHGGVNDLWSVNVDDDHHEIETQPRARAA